MNIDALLRLIKPGTNGNGLLAIGTAIYAAVQVIVYHHPIGDPQVYIAGITAMVALYNRSQTTPITDPRVPGAMVVPAAPPAVQKP